MKIAGAVKKYPVVLRKAKSKRREYVFESYMPFVITKSRKSGHKLLSPDADILPLAGELMSLSFLEDGSIFQDRMASVSLSGIFRALTLFKHMYPKEYEVLKTLMMMLSYSIDENLLAPPLYILNETNIKEIEALWQRVKEITGMGKEDYMLAVIKEFKEKGMFDIFSLYIPERDEDEEAILELEERLKGDLPAGEEMSPDPKLPNSWLFKGYRLSDEEEE